MNELLNIKMNFNRESNTQKFGPRNLKKYQKLSVEKIDQLINELKKVENFYNFNTKYIKNVLIDVFYNDIIAKSGRIQEILKIKGDCNENIVGARFSNAPAGDENHIITYYVTMHAIKLTINNLSYAKELISVELGGEANNSNFDSKNKSINYGKYSLSKNKLRNIIIDCSAIDKFDIPNAISEQTSNEVIITFFDTELNISELLQKIGIDGIKYYYSSVGKNTISANLETLEKLKNEIPYLISMITSDISLISPNDNCIIDRITNKTINKPNNEPIIGVIDTLFDTNVYFSEWVEYHEELTYFERLSMKNANYDHGTAVTSIIVDGQSLNDNLNDECGNFRVRHFGVCTGRISVTSLMKKIEKIVNENKDIHVWNLCLGNNEEISKNFISYDGAFLDELQYRNNVIFVISGTNDGENTMKKRVGSPADSLNSIIVNSVKFNGEPAEYTRNGKVLSFYNKPDVSYYGGTFDERINVCTTNGIEGYYGTSIAAPWIARKICYLIDVLGMTREVAKALIIDSAAGWNYKQFNYRRKNTIGYGIVPKKISQVTQCDNSEIRFILHDFSSSYYTTNYAIPIPKDEMKSYYIARATLCYFPECNRLQGVDYTQRELSIKFGIINDKIKDINHNTQDDNDSFNDERKAREDFRKWENTKFISELYHENNTRPKNLYREGLWGLEVSSKERIKIAKKEKLNFGLVITLKNKKGLNKINDFKHSCLLRGYIVNEVKIEAKLDLYEKAQEEIKLE